MNTLALSTDYVLRTGAFEPATATINPQDLTGSCKDHVTLCWDTKVEGTFEENVFRLGCFRNKHIFPPSGRAEGESFAEI